MWNDLVENFHTSEGQGERIPLEPSDYDITFKGLRTLLVSVERRIGGAVLFTPNEDTRDRLKAEFRRTRWPKNKIPEINPNWCVLDCALFLRYMCVDNALNVRCRCYNTLFVRGTRIFV